MKITATNFYHIAFLAILSILTFINISSIILNAYVYFNRPTVEDWQSYHYIMKTFEDGHKFHLKNKIGRDWILKRYKTDSITLDNFIRPK